MGIRSHQVICLLLLLCSTATPMAGLASAQQPDIVQEHWYHSYLTLTADVQSWEADYPDIVNLVSAGTTLHGRQQWVLQISDWSMETKADGSAKEMVYIDGGHHGNEHLGTELAFLTAEFYIEGWAAGDEEAVDVLTNTELHIMILLNADGNDLDSRWNMNQVDLNRNYDHHWTEEETASGDGPFSEPETRNNADYMAANMVDADLYVTMHTGTWILAYPWGFTGDMPSDYELYEHIRDTIHETIDSDLPVRNANAGIYPTHGTSRDYGYGIMGYPTFTFETDDEQFLLGTVQTLSDRLSVELDVMKYLIENVWYWRARLNVTSLEVGTNSVNLDVTNLGHASTSNASLHYSDAEGNQLWHSSNFSVNASNSTKVELSSENLSLVKGGSFELHYQKRVIDSAQWVSEAIPETNLTYVTASDSVGALSPTMVLTLQLSTIPIFGAILTWIIRKARRLDQEQEEEVEGRWHTFAWTLGAAGAFGGVITGAWYLFSYHTRILGGPESLVVLHVGMIVVGMGIGATIYGTIADRIGKRKEMLIGTALVNIVLYLIHPFLSLIPFLIISTLQGISLGGTRLLFSMVTEIFPDAKSESIGLMHAVTWAIASIAVLLMGKLYGNYGFWAVSGMSIVCIVVAIVCVLNIGSSLQAFVESKTIPKEEKLGLNPMKWISFESAWPPVILLVVLTIAIPRGAVVLNSPRYLEYIGFDIAFTSVLISWAQLASVVLVTYAGYFCTRYGASSVLLWAAIAYCSLWTAFSLGMPNWLAALIYVLPVYGFLVVSSDALMSQHSSLSERNRAIGLSAATTLLGQGLGTALMFTSLSYLESTELSQVEQFHWAFRLNIPLFMLSVLLAWRLVAKMEGQSKAAILVESKATPS